MSLSGGREDNVYSSAIPYHSQRSLLLYSFSVCTSLIICKVPGTFYKYLLDRWSEKKCHRHIFLLAIIFPFCFLLVYRRSTEKAMAPHSSTLAWKIPWTEEPSGLQSMGLWRFGHDWATSLSLFTFMHWRRKWQPTPAFLPGESQGQGSLVGCCLWGRTESDTTEVT